MCVLSKSPLLPFSLSPYLRFSPSASFLPPLLLPRCCDHDPPRLFTGGPVRGDGDPAVLFLDVSHAHVPTRRFDSGKLRQQAAQALAHKARALREGKVFHV